MARITIPRSYIDNFADGTEALSSAYKGKLAEALASVDMTRPDAIGDVVSIMQRFCKVSTANAAYLAKTFYLGLRRYMVDDDGYEGVESPSYVGGATETVTRGIMSKNDTATADGAAAAIRQLQSRLGYEVKRSVGETIFSNGFADSKRPRFARIPRGSKSYPNGCPFCQMLASRGFVYLSEDSAGASRHYHDDCRCAIVPSWSNDPIVEGYDRHDYVEGYKEYLGQDHSRHEANVKATRKNRYDSQGRLKAGYSGLRVDQQKHMTDADREAQHRKNVEAQHAGWKAAYAKKHGSQNQE